MSGIFGDPEVMKYGDGVKSIAWVKDWLYRCREIYRNERVTGPLAVVEKKSGNTIGYCGLTRIDDVCGKSEIQLGYRLTTRYWGMGYATEAAFSVLEYGFGPLGLIRVIAIIDPINMASLNVTRKLGMSYEKDVFLPEYAHPDHVYVITKKNTTPP